MITRRKFISQGALVSAGLLSADGLRSLAQPLARTEGKPIIMSTWDFGMQANLRAWEVMGQGLSVLDAVESGIRVVEADPENLSVGLGGLPDREGIVTLDACIMDKHGHAGSVTFLQDILHPISVARKVMEETPHVMLSGSGALNFALQHGFERTNLMTETSRKAWEEWMVTSQYKPVINIENHDTIGLLAIDQDGDFAGGCSTSGLAFKMHGRVGDSPIIGAGLFVDNEVGAAVATGLGELVLRTLSAFLVVELMRVGRDPEDACRQAILRIIEKYPEHLEAQVAVIALNKAGETGAFAIHPGFSYALSRDDRHEVIQSPAYY
jgi:isoaspartyl peptidase/L-asparaginase-like protein (Ntn-hydrolase superfamily)